MNSMEMVPLELFSEKPKTYGEAVSFDPETSLDTLDTWLTSALHFVARLSNTCTWASDFPPVKARAPA